MDTLTYVCSRVRCGVHTRAMSALAVATRKARFELLQSACQESSRAPLYNRHVAMNRSKYAACVHLVHRELSCERSVVCVGKLIFHSTTSTLAFLL
jgi:hypothetical protein